MLLINYSQDSDGARTHVEGHNVKTLDMIMALYYIARGCELTKAQSSELIDV